MKQRFLFLLKVYASLIGIFILAKLAFMLYNGFALHNATISDYFPAVIHGLPLDIATAGYVVAPVWLLLLVSFWVRIPKWHLIYKIYMGIISTLLALILLSDTCLYEFWSIKLDGTVFNYLDNPKGAAASVTSGYLISVTLIFFLLGVLLFFAFRKLLPKAIEACTTLRKKSLGTLAFLLIGGLLFLGIRGGVGKSTANVGMVYFSNNTYVNHCAVNPVFSIISSIFKTKDFSKMHQYFPEEKRAEIYASLQYDTTSVNIDTLLNQPRPNVLIILMEGCFANFVESLGGKPGITPHLDSLASEGVSFTRCYANSFRTDRGTVCMLSGYPSFPDVSVMKLANHTATLPSIARSLSREGYHTEFLYGGDINFTNMNGYLLSTGFNKTYGDKDFPAEVRKTHDWGVTDAITFDKLYELTTTYPADRPWFTTFLTLASHEPWKVPYDRIKDDERANSFAYLDDCIGKFIARYRQTPQWDNTLIIILPDHGITYPAGLEETDIQRYHIPLIWTGGAVKQHRLIDKICNQSDLAATLLGQMHLPHADFEMSRDVTSSTYTNPCAVHTWSGGISFIDTTGVTIIDLIAKPQQVIVDQPQPSPQRADAANAFLQTSYQLLSKQ